MNITDIRKIIKISKKNKTILILLIIFSLLKVIQLTTNKEKIKEINSITTINNNQYISELYNAKVIKVMDGDTIEIQFLSNKPSFCQEKEKIRLIGINTPELNIHNNKPSEYYAKEAAFFTKNELYNKNIQLEIDDTSQIRDKYNRLIAYVWIDGFLFNKILVETGNAKYYPNFKFNQNRMKLFEKAQEYAKQNKKGIWSK